MKLAKYDPNGEYVCQVRILHEAPTRVSREINYIVVFNSWCIMRLLLSPTNRADIEMGHYWNKQCSRSHMYNQNVTGNRQGS